MSCSAISAWRCSQASPSRAVHRHHRLPAFESTAHEAIIWRFAAAFWASAQVGSRSRPGPQLGVGQVGVGAAATGPVGQVRGAHHHGEDALDPGERAVGAAAEPAVIQYATPLRRTRVRAGLACPDQGRCGLTGRSWADRTAALWLGKGYQQPSGIGRPAGSLSGRPAAAPDRPPVAGRRQPPVLVARMRRRAGW
jgi:hypothetical protein